jgi:hypothetical protein
MEEDSPQAAETTPDDDGKPDLDELKRQFRAALDRKRSVHADSGTADGGKGQGKVHAHGPASSRRSFRRKSG